VAILLLSLSEEIQVPPAELRVLAETASRRYRRKKIPRPGRAPRIIDAPDEDLKAVQRMILRRVLSRLPVSKHAHGFVPGRSAVSGARLHVGKEFVVALDIRDFFPSIEAPAARRIAEELGMPSAEVRDFVALTTVGGRLPQGAPTSPALANLAFRRCDARLGGLAESLGLSYSRYADDLAFSGCAAALRIESSVRRVLEDGGFELAAEKTRVMRRSDRQEVCGLVVNDGVRLPREHRRLLRAILHEMGRSGAAAAARGRGSRFPQWLAGHLAYLAAVDREEAERMVCEFERLASERGAGGEARGG
jgi:hypothetical protein